MGVPAMTMSHANPDAFASMGAANFAGLTRLATLSADEGELA